MRTMYECVAGLDVHKKTVVATRMEVTPEKRIEWETETFGTTTPELLELHDWLQAWPCSHVAMESTGDYWKPVYNLLEDDFELLVVNAQRVARAGTEDRREGCRMAGGTDVARAAESKLHTAEAAAGVAGADPLSRPLDPRADADGEPGAEVVGRGEHQAVVGSDGCARSVSPGDVGGASGR